MCCGVSPKEWIELTEELREPVQEPAEKERAATPEVVERQRPNDEPAKASAVRRTTCSC